MPIPRVNLHPATGWLWVERPSDNLQQVEHTSRFVPVHVTRAASTWINHARPQACPGCTCHWPCSSWQGAHDAQDCADPKNPHTPTHMCGVHALCNRATQSTSLYNNRAAPNGASCIHVSTQHHTCRILLLDKPLCLIARQHCRLGFRMAKCRCLLNLTSSKATAAAVHPKRHTNTLLSTSLAAQHLPASCTHQCPGSAASRS